MRVNLKELRKKKGWSVVETSLQLGISVDYVKSLEQGRKTPSMKLAQKIVNVFECSGIDAIIKAS